MSKTDLQDIGWIWTKNTETYDSILFPKANSWNNPQLKGIKELPNAVDCCSKSRNQNEQAPASEAPK